MTRIICRQMIRALLLLIVAMPVASASERLQAHIAEYKIKISLLGGQLRTQVFDLGNSYMARSVITPTGFASVLMNGSIVEQSEFALLEDGVRPHHYQSVDTLSSDHKNMAFDFDWDEQAVSGSINDEEFLFEFADAVHDRVSIQYELMHNLLNGKIDSQYSLLDGDELKELTVTNIGTRRVKVPFGRFDAIGIQHSAKESSRVSTLWCVEELGYLPVIIEQHRNGKLRVRAVLTGYTKLEAEAPVAGGQD